MRRGGEAWVKEGAGRDHSPQQIAGWLRIEYPDNESMQVSHETIYRARRGDRDLGRALHPLLQLVALPEGTQAERVCEALAQSITTLPVQLRRSLTWDQGHEMSLHRRFSVKTGVDVYFCDPRSPWQRGSNENTNGLLRQYFPKGQSLAGITQDRLDEVAELLNGRPRKTLGFRTPAEKLTELIEGLAETAAER